MRSASGCHLVDSAEEGLKIGGEHFLLGPGNGLKTISGGYDGIKSAAACGPWRGFRGKPGEHVVFPQNPALHTADLRLDAGGPAPMTTGTSMPP